MLHRRTGGLNESVPSLAEKRDAEISDHALDLLQNLHLRVEMIEHVLGLHPCLAIQFWAVLAKIAQEEGEVVTIGLNYEAQP